MMFTTKKSLLISCCFFLTVGLFAQNKIGGGAGIGFAKLTGDLGENGSAGLSYFLEGAYYLTDQFAVGVEGNFNAIGFKNEEAGFADLSFYGAGLYLVKAEYFFIDKNFTPYASLGLGFSKISTPELSGIDENGQSVVLIPEEKKFNFAVSPRLGVLIGGFGVEFTYNIAGKTPDTEYFNTSVAGEPFNFYTIAAKYRYIFEY